MQCYIYRSEKKKGSYIFLNKKDNFEVIPEKLLQLLGTPTFSFDFELEPDKKLIQNDSTAVMKHLQDNGYFLHLPPGGKQLIEKVGDIIYH